MGTGGDVGQAVTWGRRSRGDKGDLGQQALTWGQGDVGTAGQALTWGQGDVGTAWQALTWGQGDVGTAGQAVLTWASSRSMKRRISRRMSWANPGRWSRSSDPHSVSPAVIRSQSSNVMWTGGLVMRDRPPLNSS